MKTERANAKINLYLDVVSKRPNGYHDIVSIMQTVSLCDFVTVGFCSGNATCIRLEASGNPDMPTDCRNLAWRAAEALLTAAGAHGEVFISIEKHIPMAAGLAGGSSDAAAVLRGLNALLPAPLSLSALCAIGARLGADIPFCIVGGGALVGGIGDVLTEIPAMPSCTLVVACMGEGVSTPWAYGELDARYDDFAHAEPNSERVEHLLYSIQTDGALAACKDFYNLFEEVVPATHPAVDRIKDEMHAAGAERAMMSGSGPSVFGVFAEQAQAESACEKLKRLGAHAFVCHPTGKYRNDFF